MPLHDLRLGFDLDYVRSVERKSRSRLDTVLMPNIDRELKIRLPKTYVKNIPVKFHPGIPEP